MRQHIDCCPEVEEIFAIAKGLSAMAPVKAIWKLDKQDLSLVGLNSSTLEVGSNVKIVNWAPQNDLLGHPNVKVFFTQGGTNSYNEVRLPILHSAFLCLQDSLQ